MTERVQSEAIKDVQAAIVKMMAEIGRGTQPMSCFVTVQPAAQSVHGVEQIAFAFNDIHAEQACSSYKMLCLQAHALASFIGDPDSARAIGQVWTDALAAIEKDNDMDAFMGAVSVNTSLMRSLEVAAQSVNSLMQQLNRDTLRCAAHFGITPPQTTHSYTAQ